MNFSFRTLVRNSCFPWIRRTSRKSLRYPYIFPKAAYCTYEKTLFVIILIYDLYYANGYQKTKKIKKLKRNTIADFVQLWSPDYFP